MVRIIKNDVNQYYAHHLANWLRMHTSNNPGSRVIPVKRPSYSMSSSSAITICCFNFEGSTLSEKLNVTCDY